MSIDWAQEFTQMRREAEELQLPASVRKQAS